MITMWCVLCSIAHSLNGMNNIGLSSMIYANMLKIERKCCLLVITNMTVVRAMYTESTAKQSPLLL